MARSAVAAPGAASRPRGLTCASEITWLRSGTTRTLSVGLPIPQRVVGALNLYSRHAEPFAPGSVVTAEAFAGYAGAALANAALANAALVQAGSDLAEQTHQAMQTRAEVE